MPGLWRWGVATAILGLGWGAAASAHAQTLPVPNASKSPVTSYVSQGGTTFRTPAMAVSSVPPPIGATTSQVEPQPPTPMTEPSPTPPAETTLPPFEETASIFPGRLNPYAPRDGGLFFNIDYLLLRPRSGGSDYVLNALDTTATIGQLDTINYQLRSGVRTAVGYRLPDSDRKSTRLNSSHVSESRMPSSA